MNDLAPLHRSLKLLLLLALLDWVACSRPKPPVPPEPPSPSSKGAPVIQPGAVGAEAKVLLDQRAELDRTLWEREEQAQKHEEPFIALSDAMREKGAKANPFELLSFDTLRLPAAGTVQRLDWGIQLTPHTGAPRVFTREQARDWLGSLKIDIVQNEFHHQSFRIESGRAESLFSFELHAVQAQPPMRYIARGKLKVTWKPQPDKEGARLVDTLEPVDLIVMERAGPEPLRQWASLPMLEVVRSLAPQAQGDPPAMPLLAYDLDGDGPSEVVLPGSNLLLRHEGGGRMKPEPLLTQPLQGVSCAVLADFTGDGNADLFLTPRDAMPVLVEGDGAGKFGGARRVIALPEPLKNCFAIAAGDIDGDHDLDLWVSQYQGPYNDGQFPTPYYDANDGWPSSLLINDGKGGFTEATAASGLSVRQRRRTYSTSFYDVEGDGDLDLVTINDFAGVDVYLNDGRGKFTDITAQMGQDRFGFGMSHAIADFDGDGRLDLYMTGMGSTTARRLQAMGLGRKDLPELNDHRMKLGYGNRLLLGGAQGLRQAPYNDLLARSGWSWGCAAFDFDLDGDLDIAVANGHLSRKTVKDYCTTFWRHDIYTPQSSKPQTLGQVFSQTTFPTLQEISWNGFEHKVLFLNQGGGRYLNVAFLMGWGQEFDARSLIQDDLDSDGRADLLMVEYGWDPAHASRPQTLHLYRNHGVNEHHWIGVRLREHGRGYSPVGARIRLRRTDGQESVAQLVTGDSFRAQHANQRQFGLGSNGTVDFVEVRWPNGRVSRLEKPAIDRYHEMKPE